MKTRKEIEDYLRGLLAEIELETDEYSQPEQYNQSKGKALVVTQILEELEKSE